ncbi:MAG: tRNA (adenosine(37)-N6)-dimethylallyltransferase MiaA [Kiritimatiellae bacterium]|nr:tRNA (adenosine(37)-N6)-dimethylallyltransferase MiaA [Kiritimatiellia bacterium]
MSHRHRIIILLGPTACGKTSFGVALAGRIRAAVISADSRQIYRGLDIGTDKDLAEYAPPGRPAVPYKLIDILPPDAEYSLAEYLRDAAAAVNEAEADGLVPLFVGGTALYLHGMVFSYHLAPGAPVPEFRSYLRALDTASLRRLLLELDPDSPVPANEPDNRIRLIRAIELARSARANEPPNALEHPFPPSDFLVLGLYRPRSETRARILRRLDERLASGMVEEAERLHAEGMSWEKMEFLGLEYRYLARHLQGQLTMEEMHDQLYAKICQFAKRQDSWFRKFENDGCPIHWLRPDQLDDAERLCLDFLAGREIPAPGFRLTDCKYPVHPEPDSGGNGKKVR